MPWTSTTQWIGLQWYVVKAGGTYNMPKTSESFGPVFSAVRTGIHYDTVDCRNNVECECNSKPDHVIELYFEQFNYVHEFKCDRTNYFAYYITYAFSINCLSYAIKFLRSRRNCWDRWRRHNGARHVFRSLKFLHPQAISTRPFVPPFFTGRY